MDKISPKSRGKKAGARVKVPKAPGGFSTLVKSILLSKGLSARQIGQLVKAGVRGKEDFKQIGDSGTLAELADIPAEVAGRVMAWALGIGVAGIQARDRIVVESGDVIFCVHCNTKQPKDYKSGDLCTACGKQAEPVMACFWCGSKSPGRFCRHCGAEFLPTAELELGILLKREGVPKDDIPVKLRAMGKEEKDVLWGRARRY